MQLVFNRGAETRKMFAEQTSVFVEQTSVVYAANICRRHFFSFSSSEISPMFQLCAKLCFTSDATHFGSVVDARALE